MTTKFDSKNLTLVEKSKLLKMRVEGLTEYLEKRYDPAKKIETNVKLKNIEDLFNEIKDELNGSE